MNTNGMELIAHLEQEINWIDTLNSLLAEEKIILATRQFDRLEDLASSKQELSLKLESSAKHRIELITGANTGDSPNVLLKAFLKNCSADEANQVTKLNNKLAEKLTLCRELNTVNGQVIANNIHTRQQIVNALSGNRDENVSIYTSTGNMKSSADNQHHQEA